MEMTRVAQPLPSRVVVVDRQDNPSTDFFVLPALRALGCRVERRRFHEPPPAPGDLADAAVVLVRYVPAAWKPALAGCRLIFFMDDDVLDMAASRGIRLKYRWRLWRHAARHRDWLAGRKAELWVSTPYLQEKYAAWQPRLVLPAAPDVAQGAEDAAVRRIFYHGTASHWPELHWLQPVMRRVLERDPRLAFEVAGSRETVKLFARMPRATVVYPMPWPAYCAFSTLAGRHVGLAPQLPSPFNAARSYTKFFDITRSGAVGIYAQGSASAAVATHGVDGLVVPMEPEAWEEAILTLARDDARRTAMLEQARRTVARLSALAGEPSAPRTQPETGEQSNIWEQPGAGGQHD